VPGAQLRRLCWTSVAEPLTGDEDTAAVGIVETAQQSEEGRLAGSRRAGDGHRLTCLAGQRHVEQRGDLAPTPAVEAVQSLGAKRRRHGVRLWIMVR
jgi:hypothetical protein